MDDLFVAFARFVLRSSIVLCLVLACVLLLKFI